MKAWKHYFYRLIAGEVSALARFCDEVIQLNPLPHDRGDLLGSVQCAVKTTSTDARSLSDQNQSADARLLVLLNGNLNYSHDAQGILTEIKTRLSRHARVALVVYNPYLRWMYQLGSWLGLRSAPPLETLIRETDLRTLSELSGYQVTRIRPAVFLPFYIPFVSWLLNSVLPSVPLLRRLSLVWAVVLRPVVRSAAKPSLSVVIPARNERGNIEDALRRMPTFDDANLEIIFVEGNSSDGTWEEIRRVAQDYSDRFSIVALQQSGRGKNDAVREGFARARCDLVTILDADLTMPPEMLPRFYQAYVDGHGDFVNGNRLLYPMEGAAMQRFNWVGNSVFAKLLSIVLDVRLGDSLCGTKLLHRRDYQRVVAWRKQFGDFDPFGDFELLFAAAELCLGVVDLPIRYAARTYGSTNIVRFRDGWTLLKMTFVGLVRIRLAKVK